MLLSVSRKQLLRGLRFERVDLRVRKSNVLPIAKLQLVPLGLASVAETYASLTAFCMHTLLLLYCLAYIIVIIFKGFNKVMDHFNLSTAIGVACFEKIGSLNSLNFLINTVILLYI